MPDAVPPTVVDPPLPAAPGGQPGARARRGRDLTQGPIAATLLAFAMPTLGSNILQSLNGSINTVWVGRFLGEGALAATSNANIIMFLMFGAVFGFGMAATVLVGQAVGRHDLDAARRAFGAAVGLVVGGAVAIAAAGWFGAPAILQLLQTPGEAMPLALDYLRVIFLGLPASMLLVLTMMALRGGGDSLTPLWFMALSVALDAGLNPFLIAGIGPFPRLGIAGSAWATLLANHVAAAALIAYVYARDLPIRLRGNEWRYLLPDRALATLVLAKGVPIGAQMLVMSTAGLAMIGLVNRQGVDTAAAYGVTQQLWAYLQMPALAIGAAVSAMAAQNIGAGRWDRVEAVTRTGIVVNLVLTGAMVAVILLADRAVMTLFVAPGSPALPIARHIQLLASWNFVLFGVVMVLFATVRANGGVIVPLIALVVAMYPVRIGFALWALPRIGADALWWSFPLGSAVNLAIAVVYYRYGDWRRIVLTEGRPAQPRPPGEPTGRLRPAG